MKNTGRKANILRAGKRAIFVDENGQEWVKVKGKWWKFPEEIEY